MESETESYLKEMETLRSGGSEEERLQTLRDKVADLKEKNEARQILTPMRPPSVSSEGSDNSVTSLCHGLEEQLRVKREHLKSLLEHEQREDSARQLQQDEQYQRQDAKDLKRETDRREHGRQIRELAIEAHDRKQRLVKKEQGDDYATRLQLEKTHADEDEAWRVERQRARNALGAERQAHVDEKELRKRQEKGQRIQEMEKHNQELKELLMDQQQQDTRKRMQLQEDRQSNMRENQLMKERGGLLLARDTLRAQEQETLQEEARRERDDVIFGAQERLKKQVQDDRKDQIKFRALEREKEVEVKRVESELCRKEAEDWVLQQQQDKLSARKKQEDYAKELQDQMYYNSLNKRK